MKNSKYIDAAAAVQVIGNIYKNPSLLELTDKYRFTEEDFPNSFLRNVFGTIYNLYQLGAKSITMAAIEDYLAQRPKIAAEFKTNKGVEFLVDAGDKAEPTTFNFYYHRLKKMTLLRAYEGLGMDLSWLYDPDNIFNEKKKSEQEDWLDNHSLVEISNRINDRIDEVKNRYAEEINNESCQLGDGIEELLESLKETPSLGYPLYGDYINTIVRGARLGKFFLRSAATGVGKAIPNDITIPTPNGYKLVKEIHPGDLLWGSNGKPTKVIQIHPQKEQKYIYNVYFEDGRVAECCEDHLWEVYYKGHDGDSHSTLDVKTLLSKASTSVNGFKGGQGRGYKWKVPINKEVDYKERKLPIDPYVLGLFLGDGSFRYDKTNKALSFSSQDKELPEIIAARMNWTAKKNSINNYNYYFEYNENKEHKNVWVEEFLSSYPGLWRAKSETKYIPEEYLISSIEQRYELLAGLLDTDGSIDSKGTISYFTVSDKLKNQVKELCYSLGFKVSELLDSRTEKYTTGKCWRLTIHSQNSKKLKLFKLSRKLEIAKKIFEEKGEGREYKRHLFNNIINIERTEIKTDMTCFTVDAEDHLFLMNNYIVTHNTRNMMADACWIGCSQMYDTKENKWITIGAAQPTLYIATEQQLDEVQTMAIAFISGVDEEHILKGEYFSGEWERVSKAAMILRQSKIQFECLPDFTVKVIKATIQKHIRENQVQYIFFDYIHSSASILMEVGGSSGVKGLREDNVLFLLSSALKDIAVQNDVFVLSSTQLNASYQETEEPNQSLLRGSKAIADRIDAGLILMEVTKEDKEKLAPFISKNNFNMPNIKMSIYKNRQGRYKNMYLWMDADRACCRFNPIFATTWTYDVIELENLKIKVEEESAF